MKAEITESPVEEGIATTDNYRPLAKTLSLSVFVSNTPITHKTDVAALTGKQGKLIGAQAGGTKGEDLDVATYDPPLAPTPGSLTNALTSAISNLLNGKKEYKAQVLKFDAPFDNVQDAYFALQELFATAQRVDVITSVRTYQSMMVREVSMPRTSEHGTGATITVSFQEVRVVTTKTVKAPIPSVVRAKARKNNGAKGAAGAGDPTKRESALFKGLKSLGAVQ
jgi:hypothetical protein